VFVRVPFRTANLSILASLANENTRIADGSVLIRALVVVVAALSGRLCLWWSNCVFVDDDSHELCHGSLVAGVASGRPIPGLSVRVHLTLVTLSQSGKRRLAGIRVLRAGVVSAAET
jgi:hypothetical protein